MTALKLKCRPREWISIPEKGKDYSADLNLHVYDRNGKLVDSYETMCASLDEDISFGDGDGGGMKINVDMIVAGEETLIQTGGNAWIFYLTPEVVWFEGQYGQTDGEAGAVTFGQFNIALQTYIQFLGDPEHKPIEVPFPDEPTPAIPDVSSIRERLELESVENARIYQLNTRDREVLAAIRAGMTDTEVCASLNLSPDRLAQYRVEVLEKTGLPSLEGIFGMIDRVDARKVEQSAKEARWKKMERL
ncbi:MAG: hypothetical protein KDG52_06360 [Rhodocyclaceae bacterium]|nr:hypothetical protein [Rhodocyclaceae bacterium]